MTNTQTIICDLHEIASTTTDEKTKKQLLILWENLAHIKREEEALLCGRLHSKETLDNAQTLLNKLSTAKTLKEEIIGA
tara:strand:+ start:10546 stop:10782 length:237 start_codon:yes stop_codon:yes gene_type:complete